ncbi:hypothetical protein [Kiloniella majae]|uniref:hypothetical protein n=1 Tax=Kiloniella majae TaxID=1938558 RepID=UPI000F7A3871|nr:hypothetical protein [Kiloniella majae]
MGIVKSVRSTKNNTGNMNTLTESMPPKKTVPKNVGQDKKTKTLQAHGRDAVNLLEQLYDRGVLGPKNSRDRRAERRRDNGFWLMELYEFLYHSEGVARYEPFSGGTKGYGAEMSDEEAELRSLYHRYLRGLPAVVTQSLRFLCKDQQMPRVQTVTLAECLDQLDQWRAKEYKAREQRERQERE